MSGATSSSWEDLRKQARHLENDIDMKLVAFSKLGVTSGSSSLSSETVPLINSDDMFDTMSMELQQLLNKLSAINDKMADLAPNGAASMHTIKRHREILMDYQQEFSKTSARVSARREREELLRGGSPPPAAAAGLSRRDQYAKEANHLHSSHILVDEQINIAMEAREHLSSQRQTFKRMQTRFNDIANRFPMLNSLIYRINSRKRRDSLILGLVVAKKLWEEVCKVLISNWAELSVNERKEQGHEIQRKWNNLRTCFARELKAQKSVKSGQAASKRRPYVYFDRMLFLIPCMESRPTEGSIENSESNQDDANLSDDPQSYPQRKRKIKKPNLDEQIIKALQSNEVDDTNYCLSLVPFMKELTSDEKLEVRIRILQTFQDIKKKRLLLPNTSFNIIQPSTLHNFQELPGTLLHQLPYVLFLIKLSSQTVVVQSIPHVKQIYHSI
ncbi:unnamed protein product [Parnassius apollo]|uniref:Golgi SNAP receptor complex member 1 n=1 Tax=Parnassius apollo TaxID=110799 RepID=A0A8S3XHM0_PARAO|nr:unnamed protein product [Parnassius apollo]